MLEFLENFGAVPPPAGAATLTLDFERRSRSRQRVTLDDGRQGGYKEV
ncbi:MAG: hypothetical protein LUE17_11770 [Planctomycetaceae bacterium]|nr:hypothetical protein [Planctomycetaceae bacterium]